jgi:hypothetical protein
MVHDFVVMIIDQPRFDLVCEFLFFREEIKFHWADSRDHAASGLSDSVGRGGMQHAARLTGKR